MSKKIKFRYLSSSMKAALKFSIMVARMYWYRYTTKRKGKPNKWISSDTSVRCRETEIESEQIITGINISVSDPNRMWIRLIRIQGLKKRSKLLINTK